MKLIADIFRKKENKFDHIISLGYNCETSFKALKYFRFEEAGLFNWSYSHSINELINALNNFDSICTGDFEYPNPLWECKNTHIRFHGKANIQLYMEQPVSEEIIESDRKELVERMAYLKEKFLNFIRNDSSKLFVYKIRDNEITDASTNALLNALINLGAQNFKLLFVYQTSCGNVTNDSDIMLFRSVDYFAPDDDVTNKKYRHNGWNRIYDEFGVIEPKGLIKKKKYKFDYESHIEV